MLFNLKTAVQYFKIPFALTLRLRSGLKALSKGERNQQMGGEVKAGWLSTNGFLIRQLCFLGSMNNKNTAVFAQLTGIIFLHAPPWLIRIADF
jgi:hypothetical protein